MMNTIQNNIEVKRSARYFTSEADLSKVKNIWFLLHGYGQLAGTFINKFEPLNKEENLLIAPEALNRFYIDNRFDKIGASWMTREERENDIKDYVNYLTGLYNSIIQQKPFKDAGINLFGFSQGTATACRWLMRSGMKINILILWGGFFPPDFDFPKGKEQFNKLLLVTGTNDHYFSPAALEKGKEILDSHSIHYDVHLYEGPHEMKEEIVNRVLSGF